MSETLTTPPYTVDARWFELEQVPAQYRARRVAQLAPAAFELAANPQVEMTEIRRDVDAELQGQVGAKALSLSGANYAANQFANGTQDIATEIFTGLGARQFEYELAR